MRIVAFPGGEGSPPDETWLAELDAALSGRAGGPAADSWCELREDVRALAPPASPELIERLERELANRQADSARPTRRRFASPRAPAWLHAPSRLRVLTRPQLAGATALAAALAAAAIVVGVGRSGAPGRFASVHALAAGPERSDSLPAGSASAAQGRTQQLAAAVSLSASPANVQAVSDGVSRLAARDEGFVESSHVQVQQHGSSEATLTLMLPSARLSAALAALGRLAPVSSESQSLQDITNTYDAARRRLADATAERQALLRALAKATTEGQIESLRERLSQADRAIAQDQSSLNAVSQRASTAEVEVTVLGSVQAGSEGLTFHRGLHDAGRVLTVAAIVLLIALAVLLPLVLAIAALAGAFSVWLRYSRERVLRP